MYLFEKKYGNYFAIIIIYVTDINVIRTIKKLLKYDCLKKNFKMKYVKINSFF